MIGGQVIDIQNENKPDISFDTLKLLDNLKTGALIEAACAMGCIAAGADDDKIASAKRFASKIGLAFQIKDDILDVTGSLEKLGKMAGSDIENGKTTYVTLLGVEVSIGEVCVAAGVAVDEAGNTSAETDGVVIKVNAND